MCQFSRPAYRAVDCRYLGHNNSDIYIIICLTLSPVTHSYFQNPYLPLTLGSSEHSVPHLFSPECLFVYEPHSFGR